MTDKVDVMSLVKAAKRKGFDDRARLVERLGATIAQNQNYLARRAARGTRTPTDVRMEEDNEVIAMAIVLLDSFEPTKED